MAITGWWSPSAYPRYTRPKRPTPTEGSLLPGVLPGTTRMVQVAPLSRDSTTPCPLMPVLGSAHFLLGTYAVPSGPTLTWPCSPLHEAALEMGTAGPELT